MRIAEILRETKETQISLSLNLDGTGQSNLNTGVGFLDHMLTLFASHGRFDLSVQCTGDVEVDFHHTVEDIGIVLGQAFADALGDMRGIARYGSIILPMDEALVLLALDISGRMHLGWDMQFPTQKVGDFDTELVQEFVLGLARALGLTLHVRQLSGQNSHHIIEALFKGLGRALAQAVAQDARFSGEIPSTKGKIG